MSKREILGRHRATPVRTNPLEAISKAVSSNAGSVGRQAAVIAAASGLVLTLGVSQGAPTREASAAPVEGLSADRVAVKAVTVSKSKVKALDIERAELTSKPAPAPVVVAVATTVRASTANTAAPVTRSSGNTAAPVTRSSGNTAAPVTRSSGNASAASMAPMTRSSRASGTTSNAPAPQVSAEESTVVSSSLSGISATAARYVGVPYVWGGNTPSGWDCSGFVKYVYAQHGINIARGTSAIRSSGQFKRTSNPQPGDLVFQNGGGHVGIYLGGGKMIGAQNPSVGTLIHSVTRNPLFGYYTLAK
ncbi:C40 family peptidase [Paeniglutamicibacter cryotolerans]|uniref:Cell wall-associated NlpC family hydrolase n=1 Tax=Paeniglutamicibacter cryotolerans TaxID=670079 RepID=A0A839QI16_9MICC|nr:NlpC/P60 family protein [Paeniglutamicibacter cryotolerans]MBB2995417.1 cell wall-associated NlpC family hydrolase [Paeniglutamicibacter cryotolerans]